MWLQEIALGWGTLKYSYQMRRSVNLTDAVCWNDCRKSRRKLHMQFAQNCNKSKRFYGSAEVGLVFLDKTSLTWTVVSMTATESERMFSCWNMQSDRTTVIWTFLLCGWCFILSLSSVHLNNHSKHTWLISDANSVIKVFS